MSDEKQSKTFGDFILRAWLVNTHVAEFVVIHPVCLWFEKDGKDTPLFELRGGRGCGDTTENIDEARTMAEGSVKWDGCTDFVIQEGENCMAHTCSLQDFEELLDAVKEARQFAASLLDAGFPVNEEYAELRVLRGGK